jgi:plasmid stability protein
MAQKLIRDIPDGTMQAIEEKAAAAGKNTEAWIRDLLIKTGAEPIVKERYAIRFYSDGTPARGLIQRLSDHPGEISGSAHDLQPEQAVAYEEAKALIRRTLPGDREGAFHLLKALFGNVFEVAV